MKKIFNLIVSFVLLAGFSACNKDGSDKPGLPPAPVPTVNYKGLTFISSGNSTVCLAKVGAPDEITLEYSTDESQWNPYTLGEKISLADGTFLLFRAGDQKNLTFSKGSDSYYHFEISGPVTTQGNIMSLLDRDFSTPLSTNAFFALFEGCTSLTSAPELPATELVINCYEFMYKDCRNLRYVIGLFTTEPSEKTTKDWLCGVAASGTFIKSKKATWDVTGADGVPEGWKIETW